MRQELPAGALDRRITLLKPGAGRNAFNERTGADFTELATVWASAEPVRDSERVKAQEVGATITMRFRIRWSLAVSVVDETHRVRFDGREFDVNAVKEIGRRVGLEISATARAERPPA